MSNNNRYRNIVDQFRARSEENYIFACQAAVPLLLTRDLLYQLWNNFKRYQYEFDSREPFRISHIAISDLLLSPLCREVGHELYEIPKEARDLLFEELVLNLGEKRKNTIAAFLEEYALLEQHFSKRKRLKSIHLLTALSILDPHEMEKQIIVQINEAKTDQEKLNLLMLHRHLLPLGFESDLGIISSAVAGADQSFSPILIAEEDPEAPGVLNVTLPVALRSRVRKTKRLQEIEAPVTHSKALELIEHCIAEGDTELDLGGLGLTDADFSKGSQLDVALRQCSELRTLILSNEWFDLRDYKWHRSSNHGARNNLSHLPPALQQLSKLSTLICAGDGEKNWQISDMTVLGQLEQLSYLNLSRNNIEVVTGMKRLTELQILSLSSNKIRKIDGDQLSDRLSTLDLRDNQLKDITGLIPLVKRPHHPMKLSIESPSLNADNLISFFGNPFVTKHHEVFFQGDKAIMELIDAQMALIQTTSKDGEPIWCQIRISHIDIENNTTTQLWFSIVSETTDLEGTIFVDRKVVDEIIYKTDFRTWTATKGKALLELLIPTNFEQYFNGRYQLVLLLDAATASFPWELIVGRGPLNEAKPLCFEVKIIRQALVSEFQINLPQYGGKSALVIGDPWTDGFLPPLPNAAKEAEDVSGILIRQANLRAELLDRQPAAKIIDSLFSSPYEVLHIAAHGVRPDHPNWQAGIVLGRDVRLDSSTFRQLGTVPQIIFLNCSYLGRSDMAQELLKLGAKAVIVSPDILDDRQAVSFSRAFYQHMTEGMFFADAIIQARQAMLTADSTNFFPATYQCWGDPFYRLVDASAATGTIVVAEEKKEIGHQRSMFVARIMGQSQQTIGTGFLVTRKMLGVDFEDELLLMTSWHIIPDRPDVNIQPVTPSRTNFITQFDALNNKEKFSLTEVLWASAVNDMDAALLRFEKSSHDKLLTLIQGWDFYPVAEKLPDSNESSPPEPPELFIIGYPEGRELKIIDEGCVLLDRSDRLLHYSRVTSPGSAGSPVFNANWELIGLHHAGSNNMKTLHNEDKFYAASEGISIRAIMEQVKKDLGRKDGSTITKIRMLLINSPELTYIRQRFESPINVINSELNKQRLHLEVFHQEGFQQAGYQLSDSTFLGNVDMLVMVFQDLNEPILDYIRTAGDFYQSYGKPLTFAFRLSFENNISQSLSSIDLGLDAINMGLSFVPVKNITELINVFAKSLQDLDIFKGIALDFKFPKPKKKVLLASTYTDLKEYKNALSRVFSELSENYEFTTVDSYLPEGSIIDRSETEVQRCDIMILLVGDEYGFIPEGNDRSLTEIEFDVAVRLDKRILAFFIAETHGNDDLYSEREKLINFKHRISTTIPVQEIRSVPEQISLLYSALEETEKT